MLPWCDDFENNRLTDVKKHKRDRLRLALHDHALIDSDEFASKAALARLPGGSRHRSRRFWNDYLNAVAETRLSGEGSTVIPPPLFLFDGRSSRPDVPQQRVNLVESVPACDFKNSTYVLVTWVESSRNLLSAVHHGPADGSDQIGGRKQ